LPAFITWFHVAGWDTENGELADPFPYRCFLPLFGALFIMAMRARTLPSPANARWVAMWTTLITFAISLIPGVALPTPGLLGVPFVERRPWLAGPSATTMGVDGISLPFVILTTALMPLCILASCSRSRAASRKHDRVSGAGDL